ncbi:MAG: PSD1 and planctomycete cytochrome C domain-containing protein [Prosthecobacter sp.]|uniref:PSD1 and planctomycete cytochrome C domain-containing protein n=1 Tax=Prosthecobacter sp. TaxID=1965333 RepID=UPI003903B7F1
MLLAVAPRAGAAVDYGTQIKPLLKQKCYACHGGLKQKAGMRLDTVQLLLKGGKSGSAAKFIIERVSASDEHKRMPQEAAALSAEQIAMLREWIDAGAPGQANEVPEADPKQHWAFQSVRRSALPKAAGRNAIDAFVNEALVANQLVPLPEASRATLLRRVYIDLIGLPPSRDELHAFLGDSSPDAYERVVDRLLHDPRHGERWARHWMDVWRYSDWYGRRSANDVWNSAPQIWRWRDWIVKSLNADKGYDRMLSEMLAADEIAPLDDEAAVATGFLIRNWYALNPNQWMRDTIEHTGKAFLGLTFNCAHCHDHKYDPISHQDYFRFRAFFEPLGIRQDRWPGEADPGPFQEYQYVTQRKPNRQGAVRVFDKQLDAKTWFYTGGDERNRVENKAPLTAGVPAFLGSLSIQPVSLPQGSVHPGLRPAIQATELTLRLNAVTKAEEELLALSTPKARAALEAARAELASSIARITADQAKISGTPNAHKLSLKAAAVEREAAVATAQSALLNAEHMATLADEKGRDAAMKVVTTAKAALTKAEAERDKPKSPDSYTSMTMTFPNQSTGRRKALAEWLTCRDHPLTARVAVNHLWMRHFQEPLVPSVFDFGRNGKLPTHPALLDWLAAELMENGWSMRHLYRLIVTSDAYRRASHSAVASEANLQRDPDNRFLWRMNPSRMEAEVVRDSVLHLAGALDARFGGQELENTESEISARRSLYFSCHPETGGRSAMAAMFDAPEPTDCYRRTSSVLPQQALVLTNSKLVHDHSAALVRQIGLEAPDFVTAAFEHVLSRAPSADELASCRAFLKDGSKESLVRVLLNHNDFVTVR